MDSVTQAAFGALIGQVAFRKRFGREALFWGAFAATIPDMDVLIPTIDFFESWLIHRGASHSLFVTPILGAMAAVFVWLFYYCRWRRNPQGRSLERLGGPGSFRLWLWLMILATVTHPLLDIFTSYGTQWLWPFSNKRIAFAALPIIDFFYTIPLLIAIAIGILWGRSKNFPSYVAGFVLCFAVFWTTVGLFSEYYSIRYMKEQYVHKLFPSEEEPVYVSSWPTLLQPFWRRILIQNEEKIYVGFWSLFNREKEISWKEFQQSKSYIIENLKETRVGSTFSWFAINNVLWEEFISDDTVFIFGWDTRYGLPYGTEHSLWGIAAEVDTTLETYVSMPLEEPLFSNNSHENSSVTFKNIRRISGGDHPYRQGLGGVNIRSDVTEFISFVFQQTFGYGNKDR